MDNIEKDVEILEEDESSKYEDGEDISNEDNVDANELPVKADFDQGWKKRRKMGFTTNILSLDGINLFEDVNKSTTQ